MGEKTIGWGIIGCGDVCEKKGGPPLYQLPGCELIAVTRRDRAAGEDYARRHSGRYVGTIEELLAIEQIDAVYVATPGEWHLEPVQAAAAAGKQVLCEKPMAANAAECNAMIASCAAAGVTLGIAYYRRCYPTVLRSKTLLDEGAIGDVQRICVSGTFPLSHRLDLVHFFCGDVRSVSAHAGAEGASLNGATIRMELANGASGVAQTGCGEARVPEQVTIEGSAGSIHLADLKQGKLRVVTAEGARTEDFASLPATHWGLVQNFRDHLAGRAPLACSGVEGRKSSVIIDYVATLDPDGAPVSVDYANPPTPPAHEAGRFDP